MGCALRNDGLVGRGTVHGNSLTMKSPALEIFPNAEAASERLATELVARVRANPELVLGLPTGSTPIQLYRKCVQAAQAGLDWSRVTTFNLDEYWPIAPSHEQSFTAFMHRELWQPAGLDPTRTFIPSGEVEPEAIALHCAAYETAIRQAGGIDVQFLGIGVNGHLGFNEPGADFAGRTDLVDLAEGTRQRAAASFAPVPVPRRGITMGIGTILEAREIVMMAFGADKAEAVQAAVQGEVGVHCPATALREHAQVKWWVDEAAAALL